MKTKSFDSLAKWSAILAAIFGLGYSVAFVFLKNQVLYSLFLLLGGLSTAVVMTALYQRLKATQESFALLALLLSVGAAAGAIVHAGYDLANAIHAPASLNLDLPSSVDPRGLVTFGVAGIGLFLVSWLMAHTTGFPKGLSTLGYLSALLMVVLYLGRLIILEATNPAVALPAVLEGLIVNPIWYLWLGISWGRKK